MTVECWSLGCQISSKTGENTAMANRGIGDSMIEVCEAGMEGRTREVSATMRAQ